MKIKRTIYGMIALLGGLCLSACSEDKLNASQTMSIASFYPTIVMEGTEVEVTGTAMGQVMEVVFPGGVSSTEVTVVDDRILKVIAPSGVSYEPSSLVLKTAEEEVASRQTIRKANPVFGSYVYSDNEGAATGSELTISGSDLLLVDAVKLWKGEEEVVIPALLMIRKSNDAIKFIVPQNTPIEQNVHVTLSFKDASTLELPDIQVKEGIEIGEEDGREPITEATIMLNNFEDHGDHNATWDGSWTNGVELEFRQEDNGNTYSYLKKSVEGEAFISNCNHQDIGTISGIENYVFKFDLKIDEGVVGAESAEMQIIIGDKWFWIGAGLFPETTENKWITISRSIETLDSNLKGDFAIGKNTNGLWGINIPAGISIDNLRLDPK